MALVGGNGFAKSFSLTIEFDTAYGALCLMIAPFWAAKSIIESAAKSKEGKAYKIAEAINGICIVFIAPVGFYIALEGIVELYKESWQTLLVFICAAAFVLYYWDKKRHP
jgi:hypothetical protein